MEESEMPKNIQKLIKELPNVSNMEGFGGDKIANQFVVCGPGWRLFQSYASPIALISDRKVYIFPKWDYSVTTGKYRNLFLRETKAETLRKLKSGEYIAVGFQVRE